MKQQEHHSLNQESIEQSRCISDETNLNFLFSSCFFETLILIYPILHSISLSPVLFNDPPFEALPIILLILELTVLVLKLLCPTVLEWDITYTSSKLDLLSKLIGISPHLSVLFQRILATTSNLKARLMAHVKNVGALAAFKGKQISKYICRPLFVVMSISNGFFTGAIQHVEG
jgi:hypothetical protein